MIEDKEVIKAIQMISDYCDERECHSCFLWRTNFCCEAIRYMPSCWDIPREEEE